MEHVKGVFFDFTRDAATVLYSRFLVELRSARDVASDGLCGGRLSVHAFISGIWHGHAHPNRTKNQQVGEAGRTDDERTNGQMDERTSQQIGLYRGFNNGYGVGTLYRYKSTDTDTVSEFVSPFVSVSLCSLRCSCFWPQKEGVAHRGWDSADSLCYLLLPFDWLTSIADENFMQIYYFKSHFSH